MAGVALGAWPLVGRQAELRRARQALDTRAIVVLTGPAGVGKTRLARELLDTSRQSGLATMWVAGSTSSARIPFGAFARYLPFLKTGADSPARDDIDVLTGTQQAIMQLADGRQLWLGVDDAHLLDEASARLTRQLASGTAGVSVVLTMRDEKPWPDSMTALLDEGTAERIEVHPLSRSDTAKILEIALGGKVDGLLVQQAWEASAGNSLYLRELVEAARETRQLAQVGGIWHLRGPLVASGRLRELIRVRFAHVDDRTRRTLETLAVAEPIDRYTLGLVSGDDPVEDAERHGLVACDDDPAGVRLAHPLYGEVLRESMPFTRRQIVTRQLADTLEKTGASADDELLRYVLWRLDTREALPADLLLRAARRALESSSLSLAERLARAGVDVDGGPRALTLLAIVRYRQGRWKEALDDLERINPSDDSTLTEVAVLKTSILQWFPDRFTEAKRVLSDAEARVRDRDCQAWLAAMRAVLASFAGRPSESVALAAPFVDMADLPPRPLLTALFAFGRGLALSGRGDEAIRVAQRALDPALRTADEVDGAVTRAAGTILLSHLCCGRLDEAEQLARFQYDRAMNLRSPEAQGPGAAALGLIQLLRGRVATAASFFKEADLGLRRADTFGMRTLCLGSLAQALVMCGEDTAAAEVLSEADRADRDRINWFDWAVEVARAWLAARKNRAEGARMALKTAETAESRGQLPFASWTYHTAVRISPSELAAVRLRDVARQCDGPFPVAMAMRASALIANEPDSLLQASEAFEELGMLLLAAEAAADAAMRKAGQGRRTGPLVERARCLAAECEGAWSPILEDLSCSPAGLSPREMAVARLAGQGRSSRDIAEHLAISVRTVDSHLTSIYLKLGIEGRTGLPEALGNS